MPDTHRHPTLRPVTTRMPMHPALAAAIEQAARSLVTDESRQAGLENLLWEAHVPDATKAVTAFLNALAPGGACVEAPPPGAMLVHGSDNTMLRVWSLSIIAAALAMAPLHRAPAMAMPR
jgi:hypothetical protein